MQQRCFTPDHARREAERLRPTLERIRTLFRTLERSRPARCGPEQLVASAYFRRISRLQFLLDDVRRSGAVVADVRHGGVRFPARRAGRAVLLCWQPDRPTLRWSFPGPGGGPLRPVDDDDRWDAE